MKSDNPHLLIICDNCNFHICHTYCCDPPLNRVPAGEWFNKKLSLKIINLYYGYKLILGSVKLVL